MEKKTGEYNYVVKLIFEWEDENDVTLLNIHTKEQKSYQDLIKVIEEANKILTDNEDEFNELEEEIDPENFGKPSYAQGTNSTILQQQIELMTDWKISTWKFDAVWNNLAGEENYYVKPE